MISLNVFPQKTHFKSNRKTKHAKQVVSQLGANVVDLELLLLNSDNDGYAKQGEFTEPFKEAASETNDGFKFCCM